MPEKKATFNLIRKSEDILDKKGNVLITSLQEISQDNGSSSQHLVITKLKRNTDGSQSGNAKTLFIPVSLVEPLLDSISSLKIDKPEKKRI